MPYPYGSNQTSSLPPITQKNGSSGGGSSSGGNPPDPITDLLVANNVFPKLVTVGGSVVQLDAEKPANRISISIQNQGTVTVEIYPGISGPTFGNGGWQIAAGGWFDFNWTEDIKVYAITAGTNTNLAVFQNIKN